MILKERKHDIALLLLRIATGIIFIAHGWQKVANPEVASNFFASQGLPGFLAIVVGYIEVIGGLMVLIGLWTSIAAIALSIIIAIALFYVKGGAIFRAFNVPVFESELSLLAMSLALTLKGSGKIAVRPDYGCDDLCHRHHNVTTTTTVKEAVVYPDNRI